MQRYTFLYLMTICQVFLLNFWISQIFEFVLLKFKNITMFIHLSKIIQETSKIDFSDLFDESVLVYKKVWLQGILFQLLNFLIGMPLLFINAEILDLDQIESTGDSLFFKMMNDDVLLNNPLSDLGLWYFSLFITILLSIVLSFGFFRIVKRMDSGESFEFSDFFYFLSSDRLSKSILLMLAYLGIAILATLLCVLPLFYVMIPLLFVAPIFAYNADQLTVSETLKLSFQLGHKKWGITFVVTVLNGIMLYLITVFTCGLGSLIFGCFVQMPIYVIYKKTFEANRVSS